jgi:hypothetical protein
MTQIKVLQVKLNMYNKIEFNNKQTIMIENK